MVKCFAEMVKAFCVMYLYLYSIKLKNKITVIDTFEINEVLHK